MKEAGRKIAIFVLGAVMALLLLETGLQVRYALQQNRTGQRDPGATRTVLCVGDSFVYGLGAPPEMSFPKQLQQLLGPDYAVINMGLGGQNTADVMRGLRSHMQTVDPDVVVILCGNNNLWNMRGAENYLEKKSFRARLRGILSGTRVGRLVRLLHIALQERSGRAHPPQPVSGGEMNGRAKEKPKAGWRPGPASRPQRERRRYPDFHECDDAAIAALREKYERGIRSNPSDAGNYQGLGLVSMVQRDYAASIKAFSAAIRMEPADTRNYVELGRVYDEMGRYDEAATWLHTALEKDPYDFVAYECLGYVYQHMSRDSDALRAFRRNLELAPPEEDHRFKGIVLISRDARDEETRREARQLLREYGPNEEMSPPSFMRLISEERNVPTVALEEWIQSDIGEMIGICRERNVDVILMGYPAAFENIDGVLRDIAIKKSVPFVDNAKLFDRMYRKMNARRNDYFAPDGHCNAKGYGVVAVNVYNAMLQNGYATKHE